MTKLITLLIVINLFFSCSKRNDIKSKPVSPMPDTLATGWSRVLMNDDFFVDIYFINDSIGYMAGTKGIYRSSDGGKTWNKIPNIGEGYNIAATANGKVFIVAPDIHSIYQSFDNGNTFSELMDNAGDRISDIYFTGNDTGYIPAGANNLLQSLNGGVSWQYVKLITGLSLGGSGLYTPFFINQTTGWISDGETIFRTNGSISSWVKCGFVSNPASSINNTNISIFAPTSDIVYIGTSDLSHAIIYKSVNGGKDFYLTGSLDSNNPGYVDIHFTDVNNGYVSANRKIYQTTDGGTTWKNVVSLGESNIIEIHFTDANHGWACGNGTVLIYKK